MLKKPYDKKQSAQPPCWQSALPGRRTVHTITRWADRRKKSSALPAATNRCPA